MLFSEPKIPQSGAITSRYIAVFVLSVLFSEPKIPQSYSEMLLLSTYYLSVLFSEPKIPQFANAATGSAALRMPFSALQRAENSSIACCGTAGGAVRNLSVLFSEPKIPQSLFPQTWARFVWLSVLFSEPKIPQFALGRSIRHPSPTFSALQRAENSSIPNYRIQFRQELSFQCSSASRKFLNRLRT